MTRLVIDIPKDKNVDEIIQYLEGQGVSNPLVIDEDAEDEHLSKMMDEADRSKKVSLDDLKSLID